MMTILKTTNNGDFDDVNVRRILTLDKCFPNSEARVLLS